MEVESTRQRGTTSNFVRTLPLSHNTPGHVDVIHKCMLPTQSTHSTQQVSFDGQTTRLASQCTPVAVCFHLLCTRLRPLALVSARLLVCTSLHPFAPSFCIRLHPFGSVCTCLHSFAPFAPVCTRLHPFAPFASACARFSASVPVCTRSLSFAFICFSKIAFWESRKISQVVNNQMAHSPIRFRLHFY